MNIKVSRDSFILPINSRGRGQSGSDFLKMGVRLYSLKS